MEKQKLKIKFLSLSRAEPIGTELVGKVVVGVLGKKYYFDMCEKALKFHRKEFMSFEKDGYDASTSIISLPLTKKEMNYATGK